MPSTIGTTWNEQYGGSEYIRLNAELLLQRAREGVEVYATVLEATFEDRLWGPKSNRDYAGSNLSGLLPEVLSALRLNVETTSLGCLLGSKSMCDSFRSNFSRSLAQV